jgi:hypothetical protein
MISLVLSTSPSAARPQADRATVAGTAGTRIELAFAEDGGVAPLTAVPER